GAGQGGGEQAGRAEAAGGVLGQLATAARAGAILRHDGKTSIPCGCQFILVGHSRPRRQDPTAENRSPIPSATWAGSATVRAPPSRIRAPSRARIRWAATFTAPSVNPSSSATRA